MADARGDAWRWGHEMSKGGKKVQTSSYNIRCGKDPNRHLSTQDIQMANRHMKRCSTLPVTRKMQIKTSMRYHLTPVRMAIINKSTSVGEMWRKGNPPALLVGMQPGAATVGNSMEFPQIKNVTAS